MGNSFTGPGVSGKLIITRHGRAGTITIKNGLVCDADKSTRRQFKGILGDHVDSFISFVSASDWHCTFIPSREDNVINKYKNPKKR